MVTFSIVYFNLNIMKKLLVLFMAAVFMITSCNNSKQAKFTKLDEPSVYDEKLNGKVESVTEKTYWAVAEGDNFKKGNLVTTKEHDSLGVYYDFEAKFDSSGDHVMKFNLLNDNNSIVSKWQYFKEKNRLSMTKWTLGDHFNIQVYKSPISGYTRYEYNDKGQRTKGVDYMANVDTIIYTWPENHSEAGDTTKVQQFDNKGILLDSWINLFNDKKQYMGGVNYGKDDVIKWLWEIKYNEKGYWSEWTNYDKDKKVITVYTRTYPEYDAKGNWINAITKDNKDHTWYSERAYSYFQ